MKYILSTLALIGYIGLAHAEETMGEKAKDTMNDAKRATKKGYNRAAEAACGKLTGDNKAECLAKQAKNRTEEGWDATKDKASEVKNSVDSDKKSE
jgi:hypothetical protein